MGKLDQIQKVDEQKAFGEHLGQNRFFPVAKEPLRGEDAESHSSQSNSRCHCRR